MSLKDDVEKLAHDNPELRPHLVPLLRRTAAANDSPEFLAAEIQRACLRAIKPAAIKAAVQSYVKAAGISVQMRSLLEDLVYAVKVDISAKDVRTEIKANTIPNSKK